VFLQRIYAVVKATTRANPSERVGTLEMLDFVIRSIGYSAHMLHHYAPYPPVPAPARYYAADDAVCGPPPPASR
jgi:hypothetical protein